LNLGKEQDFSTATHRCTIEQSRKVCCPPSQTKKTSSSSSTTTTTSLSMFTKRQRAQCGEQSHGRRVAQNNRPINAICKGSRSFAAVSHVHTNPRPCRLARWAGRCGWRRGKVGNCAQPSCQSSIPILNPNPQSQSSIPNPQSIQSKPHSTSPLLVSFTPPVQHSTASPAPLALCGPFGLSSLPG